MKWYYAEGGKQVGPVEEAVLEDLVRQGTVRDDTLVWHEGMASWQRYSTAGGGSKAVEAALPPPVTAPAGDMRYCSECGRPFPASQLSISGDRAVCGQCQPAYSQRMPQGGSARHFGGFWIRFLALIIDAILLGVVGAIIRIPLGLAMGGVGLGLGSNPDPAQALAALPAILSLAGLAGLIQIGLSMAYEIYFLSTRGATPGKMALGLTVMRADGSTLSAGLAGGRFFARFLGWMTLGIGFIIAAFDREKRALHDHICGTRVIYNR